MSRIIHASIDAETEKVLRDLRGHLGWDDSRIVREGVKALAVLLVRRGRRRIIGLGRFRSGRPGLGSNKAHLKGFGG